jgi:hypothetical protein
MAYYGLIGHAYQNHLLEKVVVDIEPGFKYTFMANGKLKNAEKTDDLIENYAYCLNYVEPNSLQVIPINSEVLPFNQDDPKRVKESEIATGFFIVDTCGMYQDVHSDSIEAFGVSVSKEGILDNYYEEHIILESREIHLII